MQDSMQCLKVFPLHDLVYDNLTFRQQLYKDTASHMVPLIVLLAVHQEHCLCQSLFDALCGVCGPVLLASNCPQVNTVSAAIGAMHWMKDTSELNEGGAATLVDALTSVLSYWASNCAPTLQCHSAKC
eukprot:6492303-Amphidinium_carterae.2